MAEKPAYGGNMLLFSSPWNKVPSFRLFPATLECPFTEAIYDRIQRVLVVISKIPVKHLTTAPRLDDDGELKAPKKPKKNGKTYQEVRVILDSYQEYYIEDQKEIEAFLKAYAINHSTFKYKPLLEPVNPAEAAQPKMEVVK